MVTILIGTFLSLLLLQVFKAAMVRGHVHAERYDTTIADAFRVYRDGTPALLYNRLHDAKAKADTLS